MGRHPRLSVAPPPRVIIDVEDRAATTHETDHERFDEHAGRLADPGTRTKGIARDADPNYLVSCADIERHETQHGRIEPGTIVLLHTGWGRFYPDAKQYLGSDVRGEAVDLSFPGIGADAAEALVERAVDLVALDTASLDHGPSTDFIAHQILNGADIPGLENIANLELLPPAGATVFALPVKIDGGSGGPCRIIALLP
jgi:kynurenine formamidase